MGEYVKANPGQIHREQMKAEAKRKTIKTCLAHSYRLRSVIVFLTLCYVGLLYLLVKVGVIRWTLWWKISPLVWMLLLLVALFIPMQWGAPSGPLTIYQYTIEIIPNVSGEVTEVPVRPLQRVKEGDPLMAGLHRRNAGPDRRARSVRLAARSRGSAG